MPAREREGGGGRKGNSIRKNIIYFSKLNEYSELYKLIMPIIKTNALRMKL